MPEEEGNNDDIWNAPYMASVFESGSGYGSKKFDALVTQKHIKLIVCDDCIEKWKFLTKDVNINLFS